MGDDVMSCEIDLFGSMYIAGRDQFYKQCVLSTTECIYIFLGNLRFDYERLNDFRQESEQIKSTTPKMMTVYTEGLWTFVQ